ncbi:MAG TPA: M50 family metallopeptidase [Candidatus Acidoferrum sp.]|nr:M50 family metallopeptidase [Candidatus Acidoferrum sp.]
MPTRQGSIKLFRLFGIDVYAHWMWFLLLLARIVSHDPRYGSLARFLCAYLTLFLIVLIHEFGHALACRSVGGRANQIVLWLLGGVAYVSPPQRPGAMLWSIAAGPLVNVVLFPVFSLLWIMSHSAGWFETQPGLYLYIRDVWFINTGLLVFNLMPVYPLDGGQILRSLLWFIFGRARSLLIASIVGFVGVAALVALTGLLFVFSEDRTSAVLLGVMAAFILFNCWGGLLQARAMARLTDAPRREGFACPVCRAAPPQGAFWICGKCRKPFDTFLTRAICPSCGAQYGVTSCPECGSLRPVTEWESFLNLPPKL